MSDGEMCVRLHSDAGGEFWNHIMDEVTHDLCILQTRTEGHDPRANGKAERYVGIMKHHATETMMKTNMPIQSWHWAMRNSAYNYRCKRIDIQIPPDAPEFG